MRWIKGDGLDDDVTRAAIATATRLFGNDVDYCLCTNSIEADRVREILAWAAAPVEWWPLTPSDNEALTRQLAAVGAGPEQYGYWWKWFPERVRPDAPEWILDGDMVVVARPTWFDAWAAGTDGVRLSAEDSDRHGTEKYGDHGDLVDPSLQLHSGLLSLPPGLRYMSEFDKVLAERPLASPHDGRTDMSEQGVVAVAFERLGAAPFPLNEFPFARAFEPDLDFGREGDLGKAWGYHFGHSFVRANPHFDRMVAEGIILSCPEPTLAQRFRWLTGFGQWGVPGWGLGDECAQFIVDVVGEHGAEHVLELGTSRGHLTAMLCTSGCRVTTVDAVDRGASVNLAGLSADVVLDEGYDYLARSRDKYDALVIDVHGNTEARWRQWAPLLKRSVRRGGLIVIDNLRLAEIPEWRDETGVKWLMNNLPRGLRVERTFDPLPGVLVLRRG